MAGFHAAIHGLVADVEAQDKDELSARALISIGEMPADDLEAVCRTGEPRNKANHVETESSNLHRSPPIVGGQGRGRSPRSLHRLVGVLFCMLAGLI